MDQGSSYASEIPKLGKDSLGTWLSRWPWNSSIGKERWQEALIMDMGRGNLLIQPWLGEDPLDEDEEQELALFLKLLRLRKNCFANSQLILGDPWKNEPYGYACADGKRSFISFNNFSWHDYCLRFDNHAVFGLSSTDTVRIFRHYPSPAELPATSDWLRPFQVALYEIVPAGEVPTGDFPFLKSTAPARFEQPSTEITLNIQPISTETCGEEMTAAFAGLYDAEKESNDPWQGFAISTSSPASREGGRLIVCAIASRAGKAMPTGSMAAFFSVAAEIQGIEIRCQPVLAKKAYPSTWQAWRIDLPPSGEAHPVEIKLFSRLPSAANLTFKSYFIPNDKVNLT